MAESELFGRNPLVGGVGTVMTHGAPAGAGRMVLRELNRLVEAKAEFAFESTLSGLHYAKRLKEWKNQGYLIEIVYIRLVSPQLALSRIAGRVRQGGHGAPRADVIRRFKRGGPIFLVCISPWRNHWAIYENSESKAEIAEARTMTTRRKSPKKPESFVAGVTRGMRRAARSAREVARMHGTPIYVWEDDKS